MASRDINLRSVFVAYNERGYKMLLLAFPVYLSTYSQVVTPEVPKGFPLSPTLGNIA
jgi:hypothetical protein